VLVWAKGFGNPSEQVVNSVAVDGAGAVVVAGGFQGTVDFGGGSLASAGSYDLFVVKLGSDAQHFWSKRFGDAGLQASGVVATGPAEEIVIGGNFDGTLNFGGGDLVEVNNVDAYAAKLDASGTHSWSLQFGNGYTQSVEDVVLDAAGNVYITGTFNGTLNLGGASLSSAGSSDVFVAKLSPSGAHLWSKRFGSSATESAHALGIDGSGNVIVSGTASGDVDFGGGVLPAAGNLDVFLLKLNTAGTHIWSRLFGDAELQAPMDLAVDSTGSLILTGIFQGQIDFGGGALNCAGAPDLFVAKFGEDGAHRWSKRYDDETVGDVQIRVAVTAEDTVLLTGGFSGAVDFGGGALPSAGSTDIFLAKLDANGVHRWSVRFGDAERQVARALAVSGDEVFLAGTFAGGLDFGAGPLVSAGGQDLFVAKLRTP